MDTNNQRIHTFAERLVARIYELPKHAIADTSYKGAVLGDIIRTIRMEAAKPEYQEPATVRQFLTLSTTHVSPAARQWLEAQAYLAAMEGTPEHNVGAMFYGWFVYVDGPDSIKDSSIHPDLYAACGRAAGLGCEYMLFDADAPVLDGLPEWATTDDDDDGFTDEEIAARTVAQPVDPGDGVAHTKVFSGREFADDWRDVRIAVPHVFGASTAIPVDEGGLHDELDETG